jgi:integrase
MRVLVKSLGTSSRAEAKQLAALVVARWRLQFKKAITDPLRQEAERWRSWVMETSDGSPDDQVPALLTDRAEQIEKEHGEKAALLFARVVQGQAVLLDAVAERWLEWRQYPARSEYQQRLNLKPLLRHLQEVSPVDRRTASVFVSEVLTPGRSPASVSHMRSTYSQLWRWLRKESVVEGDSPWLDQGPSPGAATRATVRRRGFTEDEARRFVQSLAGVDLDVSMVLAVTGCRLEEVTSLMAANVQETAEATWIEITAGKTAAAHRKVPVVDLQVRAMLRSRATAGADAVFSELPANKFGDRSKSVAQRLSTKLRAMTADPALVAAHGWRHRARTLLEQASIAPSTCDFLLGHARPGEGLSSYSKPSDQQLIEAVRAVPLP